MVHDTEKFQLVLRQLEAAQSQMGACRPGDSDVDEQKAWDDLDASMEYVRKMMTFNSPYVVRMKPPFWAKDRPNGFFFFNRIEVESGVSITSLENKASVSDLPDALRFISLASAETLAALVGGEVMSESEAKELEAKQPA